MTILIAMLERSLSMNNDRFVLVSNYTKTLDLMDLVCEERGWIRVRLDGSTKNSDRQHIVDQFNAPSSQTFIFLLSSKAGGCGLNLIGANRLVLFDPAWNPATDRQAMARVWRDGQKKDVFIYRMLSTATMEERVYQRQILKEEVAAAVVDRDADKGGSSSSSLQQETNRHFTPKELKKLFAPPHETNCDTYDLITQMQGNSAAVMIPSGDDDDDEDDEDEDDDEEEEEKEKETSKSKKKKIRAQRDVLFPLYTGPSDVCDDVLKSVIENDVNGHVTFVRQTSSKKN